MLKFGTLPVLKAEKWVLLTPVHLTFEVAIVKR